MTAIDKSEKAREIADEYNVSISTAKYWMGLGLSKKDMNYRRQRATKTRCNEIEGVPIEDLAKKHRLSVKTLRSYAQRGMSLRQVDFRAQIKAQVPNQFKKYDGRLVSELATEMNVAVSSISKMANLGIEIHDMPEYIEQHLNEMRDSKGRASRDKSSVVLTAREIRCHEISQKSNEYLARKL